MVSLFDRVSLSPFIQIVRSHHAGMVPSGSGEEALRLVYIVLVSICHPYSYFYVVCTLISTIITIKQIGLVHTYKRKKELLLWSQREAELNQLSASKRGTFSRSTNSSSSVKQEFNSISVKKNK